MDLPAIQEARQTNAPPSNKSGLLTPSQADGEWQPETVLSTLAENPITDSSSPLPFFHILERLKTTKREGWRRFGLNHGESISDHMYRMAIITMLCPPSLAARLDISKCTKMALVHDMAESLVGDITPVDGVSKVEKNRREAATMDYLCSRLLGKVHKGSGQAEGIREVWLEYEDNETEEAKFVHDVDKLELLLQMNEYERSHRGEVDLGEFSHVAGRIVLPEMQAWARDLLAEREEFWRSVGKTPKGAPLSAEKTRQQDEYYGNGSVEVVNKAARLAGETAGNGKVIAPEP